MFVFWFPEAVLHRVCYDDNAIIMPPLKIQNPGRIPNLSKKELNLLNFDVNAPSHMLNVTWNGTYVVVQSNCGQEFIQYGNGATWTAAPVYSTTESTINASVLTAIGYDVIRKCKDGSWPSYTYPTGYAGNYTTYVCYSTDFDKCGFSDECQFLFFWWFGQDAAPGWQYNTVTNLPGGVSRTWGSSPPLPNPTSVWSSNPFQKMPDGYYDNGTHMIIP